VASDTTGSRLPPLRAAMPVPVPVPEPATAYLGDRGAPVLAADASMARMVVAIPSGDAGCVISRIARVASSTINHRGAEERSATA
jgi:hypothetical protein